MGDFNRLCNGAPNEVERLRQGWQMVPLANICHIEMGQSPPGNTYNTNGDGWPLLNGPTEFGPKHPKTIQWTTEPTRLAEPGDILFCVRGATTGRKSIADRRYCIGRGLAAIRGKEGLADTNFLWFLLDVVTESLVQRAAGSTFVNLPGAELEAFRVPLPALDEQQRIASVLQDQMATVERARAAAGVRLEGANSLPSAYLREVFDSGEARTWPQVELGQVALLIQNGIYKLSDFYGRGHPFIRMYNIANRHWGLVLSPLAAVTLNQAEMARFALCEGDLLVSRVNSHELVGKCGWVPKEANDFVFENMLIRIRLDPSVDSLFIAQQMGTPVVRKQIERLAKKAIGQSSINSQDIRKLRLVLPQLERQRHFSMLLSRRSVCVMRLRQTLTQEVGAINAISAALLRRTFRGEV